MVEKVSIDERGRITIPKNIREKHNLTPGSRFEIVDKNDKIILKRVVPKQKTVKAPVQWGEGNTFFKAGQYTFGDNNGYKSNRFKILLNILC